jgi:hypothetical protein
MGPPSPASPRPRRVLKRYSSQRGTEETRGEGGLLEIAHSPALDESVRLSVLVHLVFNRKSGPRDRVSDPATRPSLLAPTLYLVKPQLVLVLSG